MKKTIRIATVGTSWITEVWMESSKDVQGLELSAVYSREQSKARVLGEKFGCRTVFDDLEKLAAWDGIDAVYIASPNGLHVSQSRLFLQNGKHVLCEKPIAILPGEYEELSSLADRMGLVYMEALMYMHHPGRKRIQEAISRLGNISTARLDFSQLSSRYNSLLMGETPNVFNQALAGGCLMDMGVYCVYPALDWFGMPNLIEYAAGQAPGGGDGFGNGLFVYPDKHVNISLSKTGQGAIGCEILGDLATLKIGFIVEMWEVFIVHRDGQKERVIRNYTRNELMAAETKSFLKYISQADKFKEEYRQLGQRTLEVCRVLETMRGKAGIHLGQP
jgi:predicted dehydrogenase